MSPARALLHFLLLGAALIAADRLLRGSAGPEPIVLADPELEALRAEGEALLGRPPDAEEWEALVAGRLDEEILVREARARGLDRGDPVIRERLVRNLRFVGEAAEGEDDADALVARARALGLDRSDVVVRRRLVERMRTEIEAPARAFEPSDAELRAWLAAHPEQNRIPRRVAFEHVFFDLARRGDAAADARAALAALVRPPRGDPFLAPARQPLQTEHSLGRYFGADFAAALFEQPVGEWAGPIASAGGVHLVRVSETRPAEAPAFERVRLAARDALRDERAAAALAAFLAFQRPRYGVAAR